MFVFISKKRHVLEIFDVGVAPYRQLIAILSKAPSIDYHLFDYRAMTFVKKAKAASTFYSTKHPCNRFFLIIMLRFQNKSRY